MRNSREAHGFFQFEAKCETLTFSPVSNENEYERRTLSMYKSLEVEGEWVRDGFTRVSLSP
jgi:hypothetical protein